MNAKKEIRTTGELRIVIADAITNLLSGEMEIDKAQSLHKLAKNISDSLYSETKIAIYSNEIGAKSYEMGDLPLGGSE